jgi:MYXO-CTERM domain-containing protein
VTANSTTVPAPPALALALIALPILGLRRAFRRKAVA